MTQNGTAVMIREQPAGGGMAIWDQDQVEVIKALICPGATDPELKLFGQVCQKTGLDPFSRQIYGIMRAQRQQVSGEWKTIEKLSIQTSIDGFRLIAERSGKYGGQLGPQWCGKDGKWLDVWLSHDYPLASRVGVIRTDWKEPLWAVARWESYVQTYRDRKSSKDVVGAMWQRMPDVMLAKVAESLALRRAFPAELSGLYTSEEMQQADRERHIEDLPQFQDAIARATVVGSTSMPRTEPGDGGAREPEGASPPPQPKPEPQPEPPKPADAETRAKFDANWKKGTARAIAAGIAPDDAPSASATRAELNVAQRELMEAIVTREKLNMELVARIAEVRTVGGDVADVDPAQCTDAEVYQMLDTLKDMIDAAAPDEEAF